MQSFGHAWAGLKVLLRQEHNSRVHAVATLGAVIAGYFGGIARLEWALLVIVIGMVWIAELTNTAVERLADAITVETHPLIGIAKDVAAAAVLIASGVAVIVGAIVFVPVLGRWIG